MEQTASSASAASPRGLRPEAGFTRSYLVKSERTTAAAVTAPPKPAETISYFAKTGVMKQGRETISYGLLRDPKPLGGKPAPPVSMPDPLVFFSWWNEEVATPVELTPSGQGMGVRRQVRLQYSPTTNGFQLFADDANAALSLHIEHSDGSPVRRKPEHAAPHTCAYVLLSPFLFLSLSCVSIQIQPIELHVGAKLDVLGRPMTLRSASAKTIGWIDSEAKRLLKRRENLCQQIAKFRDVPKALASVGFTQLYLNSKMAPDTQVSPPAGGKADLHRLHQEIKALEGLLTEIRS